MGTVRKLLDCRTAPDSKCSVAISGNEDEILDVVVFHAVKTHGYEDTPELRKQLKEMMRPTAT